MRSNSLFMQMFLLLYMHVSMHFLDVNVRIHFFFVNVSMHFFGVIYRICVQVSMHAFGNLDAIFFRRVWGLCPS